MSSEPELAVPEHWDAHSEALVAVFVPESFSAGAELVRSIAAAADEMNHHPELTLEYGKLTVRLFSHDAGNTVTSRDRKLARRIEQLAESAGVPHYGVEP